MHKLNESVFLGVLSVCKTQKAYLPLHHRKMTMLLWEWLFFFSFDRLDWTTETEYKEEFNSEQTLYTKLS